MQVVQNIMFYDLIPQQVSGNDIQYYTVCYLVADIRNECNNLLHFLRLDEVLSENVTMTRIVDERDQMEVNLEGGGSEFGRKSKQARLALKYKVKAVNFLE